MVIGVHAGVAAKPGDHLVDVHIGTGAGAGLKHVHRKLVRVGAAEQFVAGGDDGLAAVLVKQRQVGVDVGGAALYAHHRLNKAVRQAPAADRKVIHRPLRLGAPERFGGNLDFSQGILLQTGIAHDCSLRPGVGRRREWVGPQYRQPGATGPP